MKKLKVFKNSLKKAWKGIRSYEMGMESDMYAVENFHLWLLCAKSAHR